MLVQSSPTQRLVSRRNHCLFPIQPFRPEHPALRELPAHYCSHFTSSSKICLCNSQSQQLSHKDYPHLLRPVSYITFPLPLVESRSCLGLAKPNELVTTESIWRTPFLFQTETWRHEHEFYKITTSLSQSSKTAADCISWKPSNTASEEDLLKASRNSSD